MRSKFKPTMIFNFDEMKLISRHSPLTSADLSKLIPPSFVDAYGDRILEITASHGRDQALFEDCIMEIDAFTRGGLPGLDRLDKVYTNIIKHFKMEDEVEEIFEACGLFFDTDRNRLRRKRTASMMMEDE